MKRYGIFYAYWCRDWLVDLDRLLNLVDKAKSLDFDILELQTDTVLNLSVRKRKKLKEVADDKDIAFTFCTGLSEDKDISSKNREIRERGIEYLGDCIRITKEMGSDRLSGVLQGAWNPSTGSDSIDRESYLDRSVDSMKKVMETAEELDVTCNVEVVNRFEQLLLNTCREAIDYVQRVDSPSLEILLDTYHMNIEEDDLSQAIVMAGDELGHFHVGENNRRPPGQGGHINWDEIGKGLEKIDYEGDIVLEPFLMSGGEIAKSVKLWRDLEVEENLDREAKKGLEFIKEKIK